MLPDDNHAGTKPKVDGGPYIIFVIFLHEQNFGPTLSPHRKCVNRDKTGFATKQRKLHLNRFFEKTA